MIKTWQERCEEHPDHDGIVSEAMIRERMQEEIDDLRAAIDQAQEPVAWMWADGTITTDSIRADGTWTPLYTAPRYWQGLTKREFLEAVEGLEDLEDCWVAIEAKLKEKNHDLL